MKSGWKKLKRSWARLPHRVAWTALDHVRPKIAADLGDTKRYSQPEATQTTGTLNGEPAWVRGLDPERFALDEVNPRL